MVLVECGVVQGSVSSAPDNGKATPDCLTLRTWFKYQVQPIVLQSPE